MHRTASARHFPEYSDWVSFGNTRSAIGAEILPPVQNKELDSQGCYAARPFSLAATRAAGRGRIFVKDKRFYSTISIFSISFQSGIRPSDCICFSNVVPVWSEIDWSSIHTESHSKHIEKRCSGIVLSRTRQTASC